MVPERDSTIVYNGLAKDAHEIHAGDEEAVHDFVETVNGYAEIGHISVEQRDYLFRVLFKRTTPPEISC